MKLLILSKREVESLLEMPKCIELMSEALESLAHGDVILPLRPVLRIPESPNAFALMPAYSRSLQAMGAKLITVFPNNHGTDVESHQGVVVLFDAKNGSPLALIDAASITAIRTAAVSGVATRHLARKNARTLAILGSGIQARTHLDAMLAVRPFDTIRIWSRDPDHARRLGDSLKDKAAVSVTKTARQAVEQADVVCTVTASHEPVLMGEWLKPGTHINAVGASIPTARELDTLAVKRAKLFVDRRESALNEAGDLLIPMKEGAVRADHIVAEIGEVLAGHDAGRRDENEITLFKSLGLAVEDLASAQFLYDRAKELRTGTWVEF